jgi:hypothetical protein
MESERHTRVVSANCGKSGETTMTGMSGEKLTNSKIAIPGTSGGEDRPWQMTTTYWINLTNGLKALEDYDLPTETVRFMRLASTWCEQHRWNDLVSGLPDEFLLRAALGETLVVLDYSDHGGCPRSIWQGLSWIQVVLDKRWLGIRKVVTGRMAPGQKYLEAQYARLSRRVKARLDYYKKFVRANGRIDIRAVWGKTDLDGKYEKHVEMLRRHSCTSSELIPVKAVG